MTTAWPTKTLDQIARNLDSRRVPITKSVRASGKYPYYGASGIVDYVADYIFDEDALLISEDGANLLARSTPIAFAVSGKYWVNNHAHVLTFDDKTTQRFVEFYLESIPLDDYVTGAAQPKLTQSALNTIPIPFPPVSEQMRIVGILETALTAATEAAARACQNMANAAAIFDDYVLSALNESRGMTVPLGDLTTGMEYGTSAKSNPTGSIPVLRMGNIQDGRLDWTDLVYTDDEADIAKLRLRENDVLFNRTNSVELVGKAAIYKSERPAIFAGYLIRINRRQELLDADYLNYYLNSRIARDYAKSVMISSVSQANISATKLMTYPIPAPPLPKQRALVKKFDSLRAETRRLADIYERKVATLDALKQSLLHHAFTGQL